MSELPYDDCDGEKSEPRQHKSYVVNLPPPPIFIALTLFYELMYVRVSEHHERVRLRRKQNKKKVEFEKKARYAVSVNRKALGRPAPSCTSRRVSSSI